MAEFLVQNVWLLLVLPFVAFLVIVLFGKRMRRLGAEVAIGAMAVNWVYATALFLLNATGLSPRDIHFEIGRIGLIGGEPLLFELGWTVDGLSTMMFFVVTTVSLLVFIYAVGYMQGDVRVPFFFAALSLFAGSMLVLVAAPNLVQLIIGWEGVGLASYLLIGHYWEKHENSSAAMKAFYVNKVADVGLILGAVILGITVGTFDINEILHAAEEGVAALGAVAVTAGLLIFFGAMGKSAQFPLHVWLPDAMAGPTPVSALMHAATMVTAGVYLIARMFPFYEELAAAASPYILWIGAATFFFTGLIALVQDDIKRVLAYSTVSQLGYMMAALGAGGYTAGLFHLWTHAFFKALLFLGAGSVIHAVHSNYMSDMGGLRKDMPVTYRTMLIGAVALAGIPPLAGFFSKDEILAHLNHEGYTAVMWLGIVAALVTAFYTFRMIFLTFHGTYRGHGHPHESPRVMTVPLMVLAFGAVTAGWVNIPGVFAGFHHWVEVREVFHPHEAPTSFDLAALIPGVLAGLIGIALAYWLFHPDRASQRERDRFRVPVLYPLLERKYFLDDLYWYGVVEPIKGPLARAVNWVNNYVIDGVIHAVTGLTLWLGRLVYNGVDQRGIDGIVHGVSMAADSAGGSLRRLQSGRVQQYAAGFLTGTLILVLALVVFR
ncbi:MAG TPA: NADH-quinone oxidoreductase subunit L [Acidimicrobiia bacterium]|nr:NADH-quinone oxidoreductase subunit L [Acidimicrobiia bacterium]